MSTYDDLPLFRAEVEPLTKEQQTGRVWACPKEAAECCRKTPCRSCLGRRNRRKGRVKQNAARKALGVPDAGFSSKAANEENWRDPFFVDEVKSGKQCGPVATRFLLWERQAVQNRAVGDLRVPRVTAMPEGWGSDGIVMVRASVWKSVVVPALREVS